MADGNEENNGEKKRTCKKSTKSASLFEDSAEESDESSFTPDIGLGSSVNKRSLNRKTVIDVTAAADDPPRREENPFSFKHFLSRDTSSLPTVGGARPKVFSSTHTSPNLPAAAASVQTSCPSPTPRLMSNPELASGLPDFVQDHLVVEQCYLSNNNQGPSQISVDLDNLPDFAPVPSNDQWNYSNNRQQPDIPFDLTSTQRERINEAPPAIYLPESFPFDLPSASSEVGASKSLPDFLSDGPIHSERRNDNSQCTSEVNSPVAPTNDSRHSPRLQMENDRLRQELDLARRQLIDLSRRNELLEAELASLRNKEYEDTAGLEKMIEQVEDNLKRTTKRAVTAESRVSKLKLEVKSLTNELKSLKNESVPCRGNTSMQRLASELRGAASSAEISLRQLLSGVDNLRIIASNLESKSILEEPSDFLDSDAASEPGPAL